MDMEYSPTSLEGPRTTQDTVKMYNCDGSRGPQEISQPAKNSFVPKMIGEAMV